MERKEWLKWRQGGIGSSDAPIVMGVSPYSTRYKLWEEKTAAEPTEDTSNQFIKDKGNRIEPKVREFYGLKRGFMTFDVALIEMQGFPHIRASLDGMNKYENPAEPAATQIELIEIKFMGKEPWMRSKDANMPVRDRVPEHYWPQIQHQLMVTGAKVCHLLAYWDREGDEQMREENLSVVSVYPDEAYIVELMRNVQIFWTLVKTKKAPELCDRDYKTLKGMSKFANKYKKLKLKEQQIADELEAMKTTLVEAAKEAKHPRLLVSGLKIYQVEREGSVDYKALAVDTATNAKMFYLALSDEMKAKLLPEAKATSDLEKYRKAGSKSWTIKVEKEVKVEKESNEGGKAPVCRTA